MFWICLFFLPSKYILTGNKYIFLMVTLLYLRWYLASDLTVFTSTYELLLSERGSEREAVWASSSQARSTHRRWGDGHVLGCQIHFAYFKIVKGLLHPFNAVIVVYKEYLIWKLFMTKNITCFVFTQCFTKWSPCLDWFLSHLQLCWIVFYLII